MIPPGHYNSHRRVHSAGKSERLNLQGTLAPRSSNDPGLTYDSLYERLALQSLDFLLFDKPSQI